jgi:hypothetical protein
MREGDFVFVAAVGGSSRIMLRDLIILRSTARVIVAGMTPCDELFTRKITLDSLYQCGYIAFNGKWPESFSHVTRSGDAGDGVRP